MAKRNIDAVLDAIGRGRQEAESIQRGKKTSESPLSLPVQKRETIAATFTYSTEFLDRVRRLGLDWRAAGLPASRTREGAVIQALAEASLSTAESSTTAFEIARSRKPKNMGK